MFSSHGLHNDINFRIIEDFVGLDAAGGVHLDHVADFLGDQRARDRRGDGDLALLHVGFMLAENMIDLKQAELMIDWCADVLDTGVLGTVESSMAKVAVSEALMRIAEEVRAATGVARATLLMGTEANKAILEQAGFTGISIEQHRTLIGAWGSVGNLICRMLPHSRLGAWLQRYPEQPRLILQLLSAPVAIVLAWCGQGEGLTVSARRPQSAQAVTSPSDATSGPGRAAGG